MNVVFLSEKLRNGVKFDHILDTVRNSTTSENMARRFCLLDRTDLHNIIRDYHIDYATKRHKNDAISVVLWIKEMQALGEQCPVLFYKGQDREDDSGLQKQDFALILMTNFQAEQIVKFGHDKICIDGTHGTNAYDIQLYTLMTINEYGSGCPIAFCFSNRGDENIFILFFRMIKTKIGIINPNVFMSDDAPAFYNAWCQIMGEVPHKLLCTWHVDKNWRQQLNKIRGDPSKKVMVYKTLRTLLQLSSVDEFTACLNEVLKDLLNDEDTRTYGEYFERYYATRPESWAYCYRVGLGINTNMHLESFHKTLKHIYLEGKKVKRLDKTIDAVMKLTRDSFFKRLIQLSKNTPTEKTKRIVQSHLAGLAIMPEAIEVLDEGKEWVVSSSTNHEQKYLVTSMQETIACDGTCPKCKECNVCIHNFKCSCIDNMIKLNICKHIHAIVRKFSLNLDVANNNITGINEEIQSMLTTKQNLHSASNNAQLITKAKLIAELSSTIVISNKDALTIEKKLDSIIDILNGNEHTNLQIKEDVNIQQSVPKQTRFKPNIKKTFQNKKNIENEVPEVAVLYSTKKKRMVKNILKKPSTYESIAILDGLSNQNGESLNVHTDSDHTYY